VKPVQVTYVREDGKQDKETRQFTLRVPSAKPVASSAGSPVLGNASKGIGRDCEVLRRLKAIKDGANDSEMAVAYLQTTEMTAEDSIAVETMGEAVAVEVGLEVHRRATLRSETLRSSPNKRKICAEPYVSPADKTGDAGRQSKPVVEILDLTASEVK
jgi:hypothetical protein